MHACCAHLGDEVEKALQGDTLDAAVKGRGHQHVVLGQDAEVTVGRTDEQTLLVHLQALDFNGANVKLALKGSAARCKTQNPGALARKAMRGLSMLLTFDTCKITGLSW